MFNSLATKLNIIAIYLLLIYSQKQIPAEFNSIQKWFTCTFSGWGKKYTKEWRFSVHLRSHLGEKPYICTYEGWGKRFTEKGNLKTHVRIHTGEKPYLWKYEGCGRTFTTQGHLNDHERSHLNFKPFPCEICSKGFMRKSTLKAHMRDHTGERPYKWSRCYKSFKEARSLRSHMKTHLKNNCSKIFKANEVKEVPYLYKSYDSKEWMNSTIMSEDYSKSDFSSYPSNLKQNNLYKNEDGVIYLNNQPQSNKNWFEYPYSLQNIANCDDYNSYWIGHNPILLPIGEYYNKVQTWVNFLNYSNTNGYISNQELIESRNKTLNSLSMQIMNNFI